MALTISYIFAQETGFCEAGPERLPPALKTTIFSFAFSFRESRTSIYRTIHVPDTYFFTTSALYQRSSEKHVQGTSDS
jgi:hypothetical protein